jgi:hypothetical protein
MRLVQVILIVLLLTVIYVYFSRLRSGLLDRVVVLLFATVGIIMTIVPDFTTRIANAVGVGRGVDLFFYLTILGLAFMCLLLYSKIRDLESTITDLTRAVAVERANPPDGGTVDGQENA